VVDTRIQDALECSLEVGEVGIQVAAYLGEELVVDAWAGVADRSTGRLVDGDTLFVPFSVTKGIVATSLHLQAERGFVEYDAPVSKYWPEFAQNGKETTTVRDALSHRAGIPAMPVGITPDLMCDWDWMIERIAAMRPWFAPSTTNAYHELNWGWIVGEIVRRTDPGRRTLDQYIREEICEPLDIRDVYFGVPNSELGRVAPVIIDRLPTADPDHLREASMPLSVFPAPPVANLRSVWQSCHPGAGAIVSARGCAKYFSLLSNGGKLNGVRLLSEERIRAQTQYRPDGLDQVLLFDATVGVGGYWLAGPAFPMLGPGANVLHHPGIGGSMAWADLDARLSIAITHNWMHPHENLDFRSPFDQIADAVRAVVADIK
jgi:CubicO group peptidase (beta-lactamase class C family)